LAARIYTDKDADLRWLKGKACVEIGARRRAHLLRKAEAHAIEKVGARLRSLMRWKEKT
jgi:hypothetical protein